MTSAILIHPAVWPQYAWVKNWEAPLPLWRGELGPHLTQRRLGRGLPSLGVEVGLSPGDFVFDEDPAPPPLKGHSPPFSANVCCGQTAGWTKMPLRTEVGFGPGDFVFDGDTGSPRKKVQPPHPICGACLLWPNVWTDQDATWYGGKPRSRRRCVRWGRSSPPPEKWLSSAQATLC